jgi:hypothetical protein
MTIKKSDFLLNLMMFCLGATVGRQIGDPYLMRHLAAKSADLVLMNLPHYEAKHGKMTDTAELCYLVLQQLRLILV